MIKLERVTPERAGGVQHLLRTVKLHTLDLDREDLIVLTATDPLQGVVGCAAVEIYGADGLLRSVAVNPAARGRGLGVQLVMAAEAEAGEARIARLYLLTETAEPFFAKLGYERVDRVGVPASVQASDQFAKLCPSTAATMVRPLT